MSSPSPTPLLADGNIDTNAEPQLKFEALHGDLDRILQDETISCLCLSDKILTLGTEEGRVHVLDYCGNQVRCFVLHKARVNELSIDAAEECVASCSDDGSVFVMGLCGDLCLKHEQGKPVKAIAIDPRFAARKTKEFVAINDAGVVQLSTQGWLGRSDYALGGHMATGAGTVVGKAQVVRWWKDLVAWASDTALMVYCMLQHRLICTIRRPKLSSPQAPASGVPAAKQGCKPSLLFGQNSHVYVSWPDCVKVVRISTVMTAASAFIKAEQVCDLRLPDHLMAMGLSPFGRDLALLTIPSRAAHAVVKDHPQQQEQQMEQEQQQQQQQQQVGQGPCEVELIQQDTPDGFSPPQLRIITHSGGQLAVDELPLPLLPPPRPRTPTPPSAPSKAGKPPQPPTQQPPHWPCYQLVPSLPSTTTEATTGYSWSRSLSALASLPAYATATAVTTAVGAAAAVGSSSGSVLGAPAGATHGPPDHHQPISQQQSASSNQQQQNHHHHHQHQQQQQRQQEQQSPKQGGPAGQSQGDHGVGGVPGGQQPSPRVVGGGGEEQGTVRQQQLLESNGPLDAGAANELLTFFIVSPKMVCVAHPRDANDRVLWLIEVGRYEDALHAAEDGLRASRGLTNGDIAQGKDNGAAADGLGASDLAELRGESDDGRGPGVGSYGVTRETYDKAVQAFIGWLLSSGSFEPAASMSWRLLGRSASAWERWVYLFAQARRLPLLAPHLPTESPRLRSGLYDIVLASLLSQPEHHATALKMVRSWPPSLFSMPQLMEAVASRMKRPGGESRELALIMAELYERQARPDLALATYLNLRDPRALGLLEAGAGPAGRGAAALLAPRQTGADAATAAAAAAAGGVAGPAAVAALLELDEDRALDALVRHVETLPPAHVVDALQEAELNCASKDSSTNDGKRKHDPAQRLRKSLWRYLAAVMAQEPTALSPQHAHLAIVLAAEYAPPGKLLDMLSGSGGAGAPLIPLESALAVCEEHNMVAEQVYLLGRMGNASRALHLIINKLEDIPQAIEFVRGQRDDELWEQLMSWALGSPETTGALLDHIGGHINPLSIIRRLPTGTSIPRLRDRVVSIIADFRTQTSLHEGCNTILRADCAHLMAKFYASIRAQVPTVYIKCSSWHALKHHQNLRRLLGASSNSNTLHAGAGGVWLRYGAPMATGALPAHPHHQVLQPLVGPQDLPQGLLPAMQLSAEDGIGDAGTKYQSRLGAAIAHANRQDGSAYSQRAWVGCIAPDAATEDAPATVPTGSSTRKTVYGAPSNSRSKSAAKRQQRHHAYLRPGFLSSSPTAELPALVHMS